MKTRPFDITEYLDSEEAIAEYLNQVLEDGNTDELIAAIGNVAKAKGMTQVAKAAGLGRESLYKAFSKGSKPRFDTVMKVMAAIGVKLHASA
jgi:probable addiction module antidote protein